MTPTQGEHAQPEALRLADSIEHMDTFTWYQRDELFKAATKLRRLHAQVAALTAAPGVQANTKTHDLLSTMIGLFLGAKEKIGYQPGSAIDKTVAEAVEHLKDWPYPETAGPAQPAAPQGGAYVENPAEIEHVAGDVSKNRAESNMTGGAYAELPDWLPFSKRRAIAERHGQRVTAEFNALARDVIQTFLDTHALRASHGQAPAKSTPYPGCSYWGMRDTPATAQPAPASTIPNAALADLHEGLAAKLHDGPARNLHLETAAALRAPAAGAVAGPDAKDADGHHFSVKAGWSLHGYRQGTKEGIAFHRGAMWWHAAAPTPAAQLVGPDGRITDAVRSMIEGMSVSVDVSTGDHDAGHRYFGTVTEVMDDTSDKHGVTLLVQDAEPNFAPTPAAQGDAVLRNALQLAVDHIDMEALSISHCKDADVIRAALAQKEAPMATEPTPTDAELIAALEAEGVQFMCFRGGLSGTREIWTTSGSQDASKIAAGMRAAITRWGAQPAPAASQKPLTVEQRNAVFDAVKYEGDGCWEADWSDVIDAVEQAHGIKET